MARFASLGSSIAWYDGEDPDVLALQANFHQVRHNSDNSQPYSFRTISQLYRAMKRYYVDPDLLMSQLWKAEELWKQGVINKTTDRTSGCQEYEHKVEMRKRSAEYKQISFALAYGRKYGID